MTRRLLALLVTLGVLATVGCAAPDPPSCSGNVPGFAHRTAQLGQLRLHYVIGGHGPPVVLLHGFPETWYAWRGVAPRLAARHTVIARPTPRPARPRAARSPVTRWPRGRER